VLLNIQVDSISRIHQNDELIPANLAQAANFYQPNGLLHGQSEIRAADPARTSIVGNFRFDYKTSPYHCDDYPWYDRLFVKSQTQIEYDPKAWKQAETLIRSDLPPTTGNTSNHDHAWCCHSAVPSGRWGCSWLKWRQLLRASAGSGHNTHTL
jgi:hypothetical protein